VRPAPLIVAGRLHFFRVRFNTTQLSAVCRSLRGESTKIARESQTGSSLDQRSITKIVSRKKAFAIPRDFAARQRKKIDIALSGGAR
jgi:hypothetical protein